MRELPKGWAKCLVDEVTAPINKGVPDTDFSYIDIASIDNANKVVVEPKKIPSSKAPSRARQHLRKDDVVVSMTRPNLNAVAMVPAKFDGAIGSTGFDVLRADGAIPNWLFAHVRSPRFVAEMTSKVQGALYPAVKSSDVRGYEIELPPLNEQRRIVAKLEACEARIGAAREAMDEVPRLLEKYRQSVLAAAFRGDLTRDWREQNKDVEPASELLARLRRERRKRWEQAELAKYEAKGKKPPKNWKERYGEPELLTGSETNFLASLPEGWSWVPFELLVENKDGDRIPVSRKKRVNRKGKFPYYGASGVIDSIDDFLFEGEHLLIGEDGANLLARSTPIAFLATGQFWVNNHAHVVSAITGISNALLMHYIESIDLKPWVTGSAQPKLTQKALNRIPVPMMAEAEQDRITERVFRHLTFNKRIGESAEESTADLTTLTQSLLAKAFRGELVPQDSSDEPAAVLLDRLRQSRRDAAKVKKKTASKRRPKKMPKTKPKSLIEAIREQFAGGSFSFEELRKALPERSYEVLKKELFKLLESKAGVEMKFNEDSEHMQFRAIGS